MIIDLPNTTTSQVSKKLVALREEGGAVALGRVLTLVISTSVSSIEEVIAAANEASHEHPMRVIVVATEQHDSNSEVKPRLDAEIRIGGDAGASEVIILLPDGAIAKDEAELITGLLLPDAPVVVWWSGIRPDVPAQSPLGEIATKRLTDALEQPDPIAAVEHLALTHVPGDSDLAWSRLTLWRTQLAALLDQPPFEAVNAVEVVSDPTSPSGVLLAAWLRVQLDVPTKLVIQDEPVTQGIRSVTLHRPSGATTIERKTPELVKLSQPAQPKHDITMPRRSLRDTLAEELRTLDPDEILSSVLSVGLRLLEDEKGAS